ncbi:DUF3592 domain-containing protein [Mameliella alba]|nr:DUF3592 domain-containing protein [Mameliella alba]
MTWLLCFLAIDPHRITINGEFPVLALERRARRGHHAGMARIADDQPVSIFRLFWRMGGWITLIFIALLLVLTLISHTTLNLANRFDQEGRETAADIVDKRREVTTDSDGDREVTYYFDLRFETHEGERVVVSRSVGSSLYHRHEIGERLPIWYLQSDPERTELNRGENRTTSIVTRWIALVFGLGALVAMWIPGRWAVAAVRARRYGARETAHVTGMKATNYRVNNKYRYRLTWKEASGRQGESLAYKEHQLEPYRPGQEIVVYQGIKRAWWSGDIGERPGGGR